MYYCCGITDTGRVRDNNEDAFLLRGKVITDGSYECEIKTPFIAAVADGVAGEAAGEIASHFVLRRLARVKPSNKDIYVKKVMDIHNKLRRFGVKRKNPNMQTTLCALAAGKAGNAHIINVGDSRLYRYRGGVIKQLSTDQSLVQALYEQGSITPEQKIRHSQKNVIFPVLGSIDNEPEVTVTEIEGGINSGDIIILCTDGLSDFVTAGDMEEVLSMPQKLMKRIACLTQKAADNGSSDNITALAVFRKG